MPEAALALSLLALAGTLASLLRSAPARLLRDAKEALDASFHVESEWHAERVRLQAFKAECAATLEGVERKRKQTAAALSRLDAAGGGLPTPDGEPPADASPAAQAEHWNRVARERGLM